MKKTKKKYTITVYRESQNFGVPKNRNSETRREKHAYWGDYRECPLTDEERFFERMERKRLNW